MSDLHLSTVELEQGVEDILGSPNDSGELKLIVYRPNVAHKL